MRGWKTTLTLTHVAPAEATLTGGPEPDQLLCTALLLFHAVIVTVPLALLLPGSWSKAGERNVTAELLLAAQGTNCMVSELHAS
jgi:hypothetical protein